VSAVFGMRGKNAPGVILQLGESDCLDWSSDKDDTLALAQRPCYMTENEIQNLNIISTNPKSKLKT